MGQGDGEVGQTLGPGQVQPGDGHGQAGQGEGEHALEVDVTLDELAQILGEELQLPHIERRHNEKIVTQKIKYTGINTTGPESLRHFKRTFKQALKRQIATGTYDPKKPVIIPTREDRRYRTLQAAGPAGDQRRHHLHDGRVGLDGRRAEGDRPHRELLARYVAAPPVQGPGDPLHHPRRGGARGGPGHLLPHPRVRRDDDLPRLQAVPGDHQGGLPAERVEHLPVPLLRRRQLERGRHAPVHRHARRTTSSRA